MSDKLVLVARILIILFIIVCGSLVFYFNYFCEKECLKNSLFFSLGGMSLIGFLWFLVDEKIKEFMEAIERFFSKRMIKSISSFYAESKVYTFSGISESIGEYWDDYPTWCCWAEYMCETFQDYFQRKQTLKPPAFNDKKYEGCLVISPRSFFLFYKKENGEQERILLYNTKNKFPQYDKGCWHSFHGNNKHVEVCFVEKNLFEHRDVLGDEVQVDEIHLLERNGSESKLTILNVL